MKTSEPCAKGVITDTMRSQEQNIEERIKTMEIFKSLAFLGYDKYEVSNYGNVASLNYAQSGKRKLLKPIRDKQGYLHVHFSVNGKQSGFPIHRLVAMAFIPNENNYPEVNHIDENKTNNHMDNLEWVTPKMNSNHGTRNLRISIYGTGRFFSEDTRRKIRESKLGYKNPMKRDDVRKKIVRRT